MRDSPRHPRSRNLGGPPSVKGRFAALWGLSAIAGAVGACAAPPEAPIEPAAAPPRAAVDIPVAAPTPVRVRVSDFVGAPVADARVVATPPPPGDDSGFPEFRTGTILDSWRSLPPSWDLTPRAESRTGADGRCALAGLPPGVWCVTVETGGRVRRSARVKVGEGRETAEVELRSEKGHGLDGFVTMAAGLVVPGATVIARYPGIAPGGRCDAAATDFALVRSDAEGGYRFDALPATDVDISCGPSGAWSSHLWPVSVPSVTSLDLRMTTCGPVEGTLRDESTGDPIGGADVVFSVETWHRARVCAHATTDAAGKYRIPIYPGDGVMDISVLAAGWLTRPRVVDARQPPFRLYEDRATVLDLSLRRDSRDLAAIRGVVRGPDGPVAGASVWLTTRTGDPWMSGTVRTDEQGRFHFVDAPRRRLAVVVGGDTTGGLYQPGTSALFADGSPAGADPSAPWWIPAEAPRPVEIEVVLARGGRVSGRVLDESGRPVAGATVGTRNGIRSVTADDGTFVLEGLGEVGRATVWASSKDDTLAGESSRFEAGAGKDATGIEVRLKKKDEPSRKRRIQVTGRAVPDESEAVTKDGRAECDGSWVPLDASGAFRLEAVVFASRNELGVGVVLPGYGARSILAAVPADADAVDLGECLVFRSATVHGSLAGPSGPLAGVPVALGSGTHSGMVSCGIGEDAQPTIVAVTRENGAFDAVGISAGDYLLVVEWTGHIGVERPFSAETGREVVFETLHLDREAFLRGRVEWSDGSGVAGAGIDATQGTTRGTWPSEREFGRTGDDGSFAIRVREGKQYVLEVSAEEPMEERSDGEATAADGRRTRATRRTFLTTVAGPFRAGSDPVRIVVDEGASISGVVLDAEGKPVSGARVGCTASGGVEEEDDAEEEAEEGEGAEAEEEEDEEKGEEEDEEVVEERPFLDLPDETRTDAAGRFVLRPLPAGHYDVQVRLGFGASVDLRGVAAGRSDVEVRLPVLPGIEGILLGEDGKPASGRVLVARPMDPERDGQVSCRSGDDGRFRLLGVGDGPSRIELVYEGRAWDLSGSKWPLFGGAPVAPGTTDAVLRIPSRAQTTISGRVVDDRGEPFAACTLLVRTRPNVSVHHGCDAAGSEFEYTGLRLDAPREIDVVVAGLRWKLAVPPGTEDLVVTAGADGLHRVEFGGRKHETLPVECSLASANEGTLWPLEVRLVHPVTGTVRSVDRSGGGEVSSSLRGGTSREYRFGPLPVGPWRVEVRFADGDAWRPCRAAWRGGEALLVWDD